MRIAVLSLGAAFFLGASLSSVMASQLTYTPTNPTFGGNPLNGAFLLSTAQAQGEGAKSDSNSPDLSGLDSALSNLGSGTGNSPVVVVGGSSSNPTTPTSP
jgi:curli production assembly/transport component CsgF